MKNSFFRRCCIVLLLVVLILLCGFQSAGDNTSTATPTPRPRTTVTPTPTLSNAPAMLYTSVTTDKRVISIILEGYTDPSTMRGVIDIFSSSRIPCVFFISGVTASEQAELVGSIAEAGLIVGNYSLNGEKSMDKYPAEKNIHQFERSQELITKACGITPTLFRCNGSSYTRELLQAAAYAGLKAGVEPTVYLNHRSFNDMDDALLFVQKLSRGSVLSIKLGQELDTAEYGDVSEVKDVRPAIDPSPGINDGMVDTTGGMYNNIINVVEWLMNALEQEGYVVLSPEALQGEMLTMYTSRRQLSEQEEELLQEDSYTVPNTATALGVPASAVAPDSAFDGAVFVGDSVTAGLEDYVAWHRLSQPDFMGTAQFLTSPGLGVGTALMQVTTTSVHPEWDGVKGSVETTLKRMGAKKVYIMLGLNDIRGYSQSSYIQNLKLLVYLIRKENPGASIYIQSILPGVEGRYNVPTNSQIFRYNLAICRFCMEYGIPFIDVAHALRDAHGDLPEDCCIDPDTYGTHLSDAGCEKWLSFIKSHMP